MNYVVYSREHSVRRFESDVEAWRYFDSLLGDVVRVKMCWQRCRKLTIKRASGKLKAVLRELLGEEPEVILAVEAGDELIGIARLGEEAAEVA